MREHRTVLGVIMSRLVGFIVFLILLYVANIIAARVDNLIFTQIVDFFNSNLVLIIIMSLFFFLGELFFVFFFPFNLPAPVFNAIASMFLVTFILRMIVALLRHGDVLRGLNTILFILYPLVFVLVLIGGYITIFFHEAEDEKMRKEENNVKDKKTSKAKGRSWDDVGNEFRELMYDIFHRSRESLKKKK
jgi:hypothetical protein